MKIRTKTTDKVESLLIQHPHLRDDDNKLIATIWKWQIAEVMNLPYNTMKAEELLKMVATHKLASTESIRRSRCKLQELKPALRGLKYEDRQNMLQDSKSSKIIKLLIMFIQAKHNVRAQFHGSAHRKQRIS